MCSINFIFNGTPDKDAKSYFNGGAQHIISLSSGMGTVLAFELLHQIGIAGSVH